MFEAKDRFVTGREESPSALLPSVMNLDIIGMLSQQTDNFPHMKVWSAQLAHNPSNLLLSQTMQAIGGELNRNPGLVSECINYLDLMSIYSSTIDGSVNYLFNLTVNCVVNSRVVSSTDLEKSMIAHVAMDDYLFESKEDVASFLENNKYLTAMYLYMLVGLMSMELNHNPQEEE